MPERMRNISRNPARLAAEAWPLALMHAPDLIAWMCSVTLVPISDVFAYLLDMGFHCTTSCRSVPSNNAGHNRAMRRNCDLKSLGCNCEVLDLTPGR